MMMLPEKFLERIKKSALIDRPNLRMPWAGPEPTLGITIKKPHHVTAYESVAGA